MHQKKLILLGVLAFVTFGVKAQQAAAASGGEASGAGGKASYTIGQVSYTTNSGSSGSVLQGVQQPYEIYATTGIDNNAINLAISAYPNPTRENLTLSMDNVENANYAYQLFDSNGKLILNQKIMDKNTIIPMESLSVATYFIRVENQGKEVKTFKIIKN
jgi:hypothetical protein